MADITIKARLTAKGKIYAEQIRSSEIKPKSK
jgi:hypothetical protein